MIKLNKLKMPTWSFLSLNDVHLDDFSLDYKDYKTNIKSDNNNIKDKFVKKNYGLSEEMVEINEKYNNLSLYRDVDYDSKEVFKLRMNEESSQLITNFDINVRQNKKASYLFIFNEKVSNNSIVNALYRINLEKNSTLNIVIVVDLKENSMNMQQFASICGEGAELNLSYIEFGSDESYVNIRHFLDYKSSKANTDGVYFKEKDEFLDMLVEVAHNNKETKSHTEFNGALKDNAIKNWKGIIDLRNGSKHSDGQIAEYSAVLSDNVINKSSPILLSKENEVKGNHAASVGRLNKEMLYYIMSRGLDKGHAESLLLQAKFTPTLDKISDLGLRDYLKRTVKDMNKII